MVLTDGVGHETGGDGDHPAEGEGEGNTGVGAQQQRLQGVVQTEVHASVERKQYFRKKICLQGKFFRCFGSGSGWIRFFSPIRIWVINVRICPFINFCDIHDVLIRFWS